MATYVWFKDGREWKESNDLKGEFVTKLHTSPSEHTEWSYTLSGDIHALAFYKNDLLHKKDSPAMTTFNSSEKLSIEAYYIDGKRHREDGPAFIQYKQSGEISRKIYYLNGEKVDPF